MPRLVSPLPSPLLGIDNIATLLTISSLENDNLRDEYVTLFSDVQKDIPFARIALGKDPDAVNLWIGNSKSVTALHKDNYENIYVQILGRKHFVLLPPLSHPCVNEQRLQPATYVRREEDGQLELHMDNHGDAVPFAIWDPDVPDITCTPFSHLSRPLRVTLNPGDMLYLPALWLVTSPPPFEGLDIHRRHVFVADGESNCRYHKVAQSCVEGDEGFVLAVNYW